MSEAPEGLGPADLVGSANTGGLGVACPALYAPDPTHIRQERGQAKRPPKRLSVTAHQCVQNSHWDSNRTREFFEPGTNRGSIDC